MLKDSIYKQRNQFSIVGLTGTIGSGCDEMADIICHETDFSDRQTLRTPNDVKYLKYIELNNTVFKRQYTILYKFFKANNTKHKRISYARVLLFYVVHYAIHHDGVTSVDELTNYILNIVEQNYCLNDSDEGYIAPKIKASDLLSMNADFSLIIDQVKQVGAIGSGGDDLYLAFWGLKFQSFASNLLTHLSEKDCYLYELFVDGLSCRIRSTSAPIDIEEPKEHLFGIADLICDLIDVYRNRNVEDAHLCIDWLNNPMEIAYLNERYNNYYTIAVHATRKRMLDNLERKAQRTTVKNRNNQSVIVDRLLKFNKRTDNEMCTSDMREAVQRSDIHVNNPGNREIDFDLRKRSSSFYTLAEQWMRVKSLMLHPGLVSPTAEERSMQLAYNVRINSGCISKRTGSVIVDKQGQLLSMGYNDVPNRCIPCNLRSLEDIIRPEGVSKLDKSYSSYELSGREDEYERGGDFSTDTKQMFKELVEATNEEGLNHSFCFKWMHEKYEENAQVHTRSLHAEENAIMHLSDRSKDQIKGATLLTTSSPCEQCAKKAYEYGLSIIYIDVESDSSMKHVLNTGYQAIHYRPFNGVVGKAYIKLFVPLYNYQSELRHVRAR